MRSRTADASVRQARGRRPMVAAAPPLRLALWVSVGCQNDGHSLALRVAQHWVRRGHVLALVFLHEDAVEAAANRALARHWLDIAPDRVFACSAACQRRSIENAHLPMAGLASWVDSKASVDRVLHL